MSHLGKKWSTNIIGPSSYDLQTRFHGKLTDFPTSEICCRSSDPNSQTRSWIQIGLIRHTIQKSNLNLKTHTATPYPRDPSGLFRPTLFAPEIYQKYKRQLGVICGYGSLEKYYLQILHQSDQGYGKV